MRLISSKNRPFSKKIFPLLWFGFLANFAIQLIMHNEVNAKKLILLLALLPMAFFSFFWMKKYVWGIADEVYDGGEFLLVKNRGVEEKVFFSNIACVSFKPPTTYNGPLITLHLTKPGKFGSDITFLQATPFTNPFEKNPVEEDLIIRTIKAKSNHAL